MLTKILIVLGLSVASAALYRMGGIGRPFNTKFRDFGCPTCLIISLLILNPTTNISVLLWLLLSFGLAFGAMTTYFNKKNRDEKLWNWILVGLSFGICLLPYALTTKQMLDFTLRTVFLTVSVAAWSQLIGWDDMEEGGRGFLFCVSSLFFLI